mmetsp:Transcript_33155/g.46302  ORF Transcript_33155/g.46302 Transcript_33155/m.46302 type:complete len:476 (+) Transcript_33155:3-1430(+)
MIMASHVPPEIKAGVPTALNAFGYKIPRPLSAVPEYLRIVAGCELKISPGGGGVLEEKFDADVVIVGSGVGGSMAAHQLCMDGYKVLMVEKGEFISMYHGNNSLQEIPMFEKMYERGGPYLTTEDCAMTVLAGSTFGGGGSVNWFCSLRPPHYVREEWARKYKLKQFDSPWFSHCVDKGCELLGVQTEHMKPHSPSNAILMKGCHRLGYHCETAPQQGRPTGDEGLCCIGVKHGPRQGTVGSLLYDAAKTGNLRYITRCRVDRVAIDSHTARGIVGTVHGKTTVRVNAKIVVSACGSLQTPLLLKRSGLQNSHIGQNLRLHPVSVVYGEFKEDIKVYDGAPMTTVSCVAADIGGTGYGCRLETPSAHPGILAAAMAWKGAVDLREEFFKMKKLCFVIILTRDTGAGRVYEDKANLPRVEYVINNTDKKHMLIAMEKGLNALVAAGAEKVCTIQSGIEKFECNPKPPSPSSSSSSS